VLGDGNSFKIPDIQELDGLPGVHLVVLSACETALGDRREQDGIEIAGISNAFLQRGAKSVIASLWQVNDPSTSMWMQRFYQNLSHGNLTKSQAMQQVQLDFLKSKVTLKELQSFRASGGRYVQGGGQLDLTHPYYWAPFILIGNGL
jgi:CHAT domain-containing protein